MIYTRETEYMPGDTVTFYINATLKLDIDIVITDPSEYPFTTIAITISPDSWTESGSGFVVTYADASFELPSDAEEGYWNWTAAYEIETEAVVDTDLFLVGESAEPQPDLPAETTDQEAKDSSGVTQTSFALGDMVLASATISNTGTQSQQILVQVQWKDPLLHTLAPTYFITTLEVGQSITVMPGIDLPLTGETGTWTAKVLVYDTWVSQGGVAKGTPVELSITVTG